MQGHVEAALLYYYSGLIALHRGNMNRAEQSALSLFSLSYLFKPHLPASSLTLSHSNRPAMRGAFATTAALLLDLAGEMQARGTPFSISGGNWDATARVLGIYTALENGDHALAKRAANRATLWSQPPKKLPRLDTVRYEVILEAATDLTNAIWPRDYGVFFDDWFNCHRARISKRMLKTDQSKKHDRARINIALVKPIMCYAGVKKRD